MEFEDDYYFSEADDTDAYLDYVLPFKYETNTVSSRDRNPWRE